MRRIAHLLVWLLATGSLGAVELVPREIYTPSAKPEDAAAADVLSDKYHVYTKGPGEVAGQRGCMPLGIDGPDDQTFIRELPGNHIVCNDLIEPAELSPEWAASYNRQVVRLLRARSGKW